MLGIKYICELFNVSLTDLSKELGVSRGNFYNWISGERKMPLKYKTLFSEKFHIPERFFDKEITDLDKLKIQNMKLHREACDESIQRSKIEDEELTNNLNEVECDLEYLEVEENVKNVNEILANMNSMDYEKIRHQSYALKTFFDIYNSEESDSIHFTNILFLIAKYLNIEGYRDEDEDDGLEHYESTLDYELDYDNKFEQFKKKLFKLFDYRKQIDADYEKTKKSFEKDFWNKSE